MAIVNDDDADRSRDRIRFRKASARPVMVASLDTLRDAFGLRVRTPGAEDLNGMRAMLLWSPDERLGDEKLVG